jgi:Tol biopolymer transport system component
VLWVFLRTSPAPKVLGVHQISHTGHLKGNAVVLTDGARIYFTDLVERYHTPMVVSALGGDAVPIPMPFKDVSVCAITADTTELVVVSFDNDPDRQHPSWWRVPVLGGSAVRIGDSQVDDVMTTPDGQLMLRRGSDIYMAKADGTEARKFLTAPPGVSDYKYFSPDMSRLRFTLFGVGNSSTLWEASHDGSHLRRFLPDWNRDGSECCGTWTPDGKYYLFQATVAGITSLYWFREGGVFTTGSRRPVPLMPMPLMGSVPMVSRDSKRVFFLGSQSRAELSAYNSALQEFVPYLGGIPAEGVSFSKEGQWVAYVRIPEGTLWRMRMDGSHQLQLTFPSMKVYAPRWSSDDKRLAFCDVPADGHSKIYTISSEGGAPEAQTSGEPGAHDPTWSPDGNALMFGYGGNIQDSSVQILDLKTHAVTELPGSKGMFLPSWSPDGRYVTALTSRGSKLMLFDFRTQKWEDLADRAGFPNWSKDSKYVFFDDTQGIFYRIEIATHRAVELARQGNAQAANGIGGYPWRGLTLDSSPLIAREAGSEEVYALDVDLP